MPKDSALKNSRYFCMLPWVHLHLWPEGKAFPCCVANASMPVGDLRNESLGTIWNSEKLRRIRLNMLADKPSRECNRCYALESVSEDPTLRIQSNERFQNHWAQVESTQADGQVPRMVMAQLDIRFSNLCSFRCHTCSPDLSSAWFEDAKKIGLKPLKKVLDLKDLPSTSKFWEELRPRLLEVEQATFAGGEPLLSADHYEILDYWIAQKKLDVKIHYITNFSDFQFQGRSVLEYWKKFSSVKVAASLDASGMRAEYLRKGTDWNRIEKNREQMLREVPQVEFEITPTISLFNVEHFPDFHWDWVQRGWVEPNALRINLLSYPPEMNLRNLPMDRKVKIADKYQLILGEITTRARQQGKPTETLERGYESVIKLLRLKGPQENQRTLAIDRFKTRTMKIDLVREESYVEIFPELAEL